MVSVDHEEPADETEHRPWWEALSFRHDLNSVHHVVGRAPGPACGNRRTHAAAGRGWSDNRIRPTGRRAGA